VETAGILLKMSPVLQMLRIQTTHRNFAQQETYRGAVGLYSTMGHQRLSGAFHYFFTMFFPHREVFVFHVLKRWFYYQQKKGM